MSKTKTGITAHGDKAQEARRALARVAEQLKEVATMSISQLREKHQELFGEASGSRNKPFLQRKIAYRIQELAEGGLSEVAKKRIEELNKTTPLRRRHGKSGGPKSPAKKAPMVASDDLAADRDPRLPPPGTILRKQHGDVEHEVTVLAVGFEYKGQRYKSLSKVARMITGTIWNGFGYFADALRAASDGEA